MDDDPQAKIFFSLLSDSPISTTVKTEEWNSFFAFLRLQDLFKRMINEMASSDCPAAKWIHYMELYKEDYALRTSSPGNLDHLNLDTLPAEVIDRICALIYYDGLDFNKVDGLFPLIRVNRALRSTVTAIHRRFRLKRLTLSSIDKPLLSYLDRNPNDTRFTTHMDIKDEHLPLIFSHHDLFPNLEALKFQAVTPYDLEFFKQLGCQCLKVLDISLAYCFPVEALAKLLTPSLESLTLDDEGDLNPFLPQCPNLKSLAVTNSSNLPAITFSRLERLTLSDGCTDPPASFLEKNENIVYLSMHHNIQVHEDMLPNLTEVNVPLRSWGWLIAPMTSRGDVQRPLRKVTFPPKDEAEEHHVDGNTVRHMSTLRRLVKIKNCPTTHDWTQNLPSSIQKIRFNCMDLNSIQVPHLPHLTRVDVKSNSSISLLPLIQQPIGFECGATVKIFLWIRQWMTAVPSIRKMTIKPSAGQEKRVDAYRSSDVVRVVVSKGRNVACISYLQLLRDERMDEIHGMILTERMRMPGFEDEWFGRTNCRFQTLELRDLNIQLYAYGYEETFMPGLVHEDDEEEEEEEEEDEEEEEEEEDEEEEEEEEDEEEEEEEDEWDETQEPENDEATMQVYFDEIRQLCEEFHHIQDEEEEIIRREDDHEAHIGIVRW
ncbi:exosome complex exonuclease [Planoprotostelium fungivorum]|uniref:Exosome complex exonuclease n=1 Tax=Planoprotostelium fungivorum TaxID=1890364 RepID=A0A2P6NVB6_9EUKA|nr:exosome complex exonuclease [Planoprotostelium fungivorum]